MLGWVFVYCGPLKACVGARYCGVPTQAGWGEQLCALLCLQLCVFFRVCLLYELRDFLVCLRFVLFDSIKQVFYVVVPSVVFHVTVNHSDELCSSSLVEWNVEPV